MGHRECEGGAAIETVFHRRTQGVLQWHPHPEIFRTLPSRNGAGQRHGGAPRPVHVWHQGRRRHLGRVLYPGAGVPWLQAAGGVPVLLPPPPLGVSVVVHGDDFTALGTADALQQYEDGLTAHFELKIKGRLGLEPGNMREMRVLNRIVRITENSLLYEPDPRHVELLVRALHVDEKKVAATPGRKPEHPNELEDAPDNGIDDLIAWKRSFQIRGCSWRVLHENARPSPLH